VARWGALLRLSDLANRPQDRVVRLPARGVENFAARTPDAQARILNWTNGESGQRGRHRSNAADTSSNVFQLNDRLRICRNAEKNTRQEQ